MMKWYVNGEAQHPIANNLPPSVRDISQLSDPGTAPPEAIWKRLSEPPLVYTPKQVSPLRDWEGTEDMPCFHATWSRVEYQKTNAIKK